MNSASGAALTTAPTIPSHGQRSCRTREPMLATSPTAAAAEHADGDAPVVPAPAMTP